jgi:DNA-directed RNA polymerase beta subunit
MLKSLNNLKTKYKNIIEYKNYTTLFKSEQGNFHDPDHLNEKGAAIFSKLLNNEIKRVVFTHDSIVKCSIKFK